MLIVKCDETWVISDSILDEKIVIYRVVVKPGEKVKNQVTHDENVRVGRSVTF